MTPARPDNRTDSRNASRGRLPHLVVECVTPSLDDGRFPVKRVLGDSFEVGADIFKDGHDLLAARVRWRGPEDSGWRTAPMAYEFDRDRWTGGFPLDTIGRWRYTVEGWTDRFGTWRDALGKKAAAGQDVHSELLEGAALVELAARRTRFGAARTQLLDAASSLRDEEMRQHERVQRGLDLALLALMAQYLAPEDLTAFDRELEVVVDRDAARFASWYELFPRSTTTVPGGHGTFADAERALPRVAEMGFDVIYLPPIHPIGVTKRKGPNNALTAGPNDPGSPWAIGSAAGGHTAVDPRLGTIEDFDRFVAAARSLGMEVALDYALQCSPDHPWLTEHPDWFFIRPDGTIKFAENPPKQYQDIYPLDFWCEDRVGLWTACRDILLYWIGHGVHTFRVDNPHTKPLAFWAWVIEEVKRVRPEVIFFAEAFTRPKRMKHLAKLGFTQSYTYFTWRNSAVEIRTYLEELTQSPMREYFRGNLFVNTPDILHEYLQRGGRPAFRIRATLAATLSSLWGMYSGYELGENTPLRAGSEEYLDSEKYQVRVRDWNAPGNISADIARLNRVRREHRALQLYDNLTFHHSENERILFYRKTAPAGAEDLLIACTTVYDRPEETMVHVPMAALGMAPEASYVVEDLLTGAQYTWRGARNYVRLDPAAEPAHILRVVRPPTGGGVASGDAALGAADAARAGARGVVPSPAGGAA